MNFASYTSDSNKTSLQSKKCNVLEMFEHQSRKIPSRLAIIQGNSQISYHDLYERINRFAICLQRKNIPTGSTVGICMHTSIDTIAAIFAILKIGCCFLPIDPELPKARIKYMLTSAATNNIMTQASIDLKYLNLDHQVIYIEQLQQQEIDNDTFLPIKIKPSESAYIIYTSGSTGNPKGVVVTHNNLTSVFHSWNEIYQLDKIKTHLQMANFSFDVFIGDTVRALCSGNTLVLCPKQYLLNPKKLYELISKHQIQFAEFVPVILRKLIQYVDSSKKTLHFMKIVVCGSDSWSVKEYKYFRKVLDKNIRLINSYGLTECTIDSTYFEHYPGCFNTLSDDALVPIGQPLPNAAIYIVNQQNQLVDDNNTGEICIAGGGIAQYYDDSNINNRFIKLPEISKNRLYKTGDIGYKDTRGTIHLLGRTDQQIKLNGIRISPSEIEKKIKLIEPIKDCLVVAKKLMGGKKKIIATVTTIDNKPLPPMSYLRSLLKIHLPSYMIPKQFYHVSSLPITFNGKLNRAFDSKQDLKTVIKNQYSLRKAKN